MNKFEIGELAIVLEPHGRPVGQCIITVTPANEMVKNPLNGKWIRAGWYAIRVGTLHFQVPEHQLRKISDDDGRQVTTWDQCDWQPQKGTRSLLAPKRQITRYKLPTLTRSIKL